MNCPYCKHKLPPQTTICPHCGTTVPRTEKELHRTRPQTWLQRHRWISSTLTMLLAFLLVSIAIIMISGFISSYKLNREYTRGALTPQVSAITMSDDRPGHSILFYGKDGDAIFIPELNTSYRIAGGVARVAIADGVWFDDDTIETVDNAVVILSPMLVSKGGESRQLPQISIEIEPPQSPLTVTEPKEDVTTVFTTLMPLTFNVVPGSTVLINGTDATSQVDRNGDITYNVNIEAVGDNQFSILVKTPNHRETRKDVIYRRDKMDIEISLDASVSTTSSASTMKVTGVTEPDSVIVVDSRYVEGSVTVDHETGKFSFIAVFDTIGINNVRFHAQREDDERASISFQVKYVPSLNEYSRSAWAMDYTSLCQLYEQWKGRVFLCKGYVTDVFYEGDIQYVVMNVAKAGEEEQLLILQNESGIALPDRTTLYEAYADVSGRMYYKSDNYPVLVARYMDESDN